MIATRLAAFGTTLVLAGSLAACGGSSETEELAKESCDLIRSIDISDFEDADDLAAAGEEASMKNLEKLAEFAEKSEALAKKAEKAGISDKDLEAAVRDECGDELKELEELGAP